MEIELYQKINNPMEAITQLGDFFAKSGMFGCQKSEQGQVLAMACLAEKKSPFDILRNYHLIDGKLSKRADAFLADFNAAGGKHKILSRTPDCASVQLTFNGESSTFTFTWKDAQDEPFVWRTVNGKKELKHNWATPRARMQMLWARAVSDGVRTMAPGIAAGIYAPEEMDETPATVTPLFTAPVAAPVAAPVIEVKADVKPEPPAPSKTVVAPPVVLTAPVPMELVKPEPDLIMVEALEKVIPADMRETVLKWCEAKGHLSPDAVPGAAMLGDINPNTAKNIVKYPAQFLARVKEDMKNETTQH